MLIISDIDFRKTDLLGSLFHHSNLFGANFFESKNYVIDPFNNKLKKAIFSVPEVYSLLDFLDIIIK